MLTSKQRSKLRAIAQTLEPITQVGKSGVTDAFLDGVKSAIEKREIVKITVLQNVDEEVKEIGNLIAEGLGAEFVCATGRKLVFYKRSDKEGVKHIEF